MSVDVLSWVWKHSSQKSTALLVLLAIADSCNPDGECYPGTKHLAHKARISIPTLHSVLYLLEHCQEIGIGNGEGKAANGGVTNRYYVNGYRLSLEPPLPAVYSQTHIEYAQKLARKKTQFVHVDTPVNPSLQGIKTTQQGIKPGKQPPVNTTQQPPVKPGKHKPSLEPLVEPKESPAIAGRDTDTAITPEKLTGDEWRALLAAISEVFKAHGSEAINYANMLTGRAKLKGWKSGNVTPPVCADELRLWWRWYQARNPGVSQVKKPELVFSAITEYRRVKPSTNGNHPVISDADKAILRPTVSDGVWKKRSNGNGQ